jgi:hypothetical protein
MRAEPTRSWVSVTAGSPDPGQRKLSSRSAARPGLVWHLLSDPQARYHDLGADLYGNRLSPQRKTRKTHVRQLEGLGYQVTLEPAA